MTTNDRPVVDVPLEEFEAGLRQSRASVVARFVAVETLIKERDEARAALAKARDDALEEAARAASRAAWKHCGDDAISTAMDRAALEQVNSCVAEIDALRFSPPRPAPAAIIDKWMRVDEIKLRVGEMTAQEVRTVLAVLAAIKAEMGR